MRQWSRLARTSLRSTTVHRVDRGGVGRVFPCQRPFGRADGIGAGGVATAAVIVAAAAAAAYCFSSSPNSGAKCDAHAESSGNSSWWNSRGVEQRGRYVLMKELGRGGFSVVRLAMDMETEELLAAKIFDPKFCSMQDIESEIDILRHLGKHKNLVSLHDVLYLKNETIMFTDLVEGGELFDYIVDMGSVSEQDASRLLRDVCQALQYVHSVGVCHRDLKPENVLLSDQSSNAGIKIADFGLSRRQRRGEKVVETHPNGTVAYWAPEIIRRLPQDFGVDMWAFGVLAYITLTGIHPFDPRGDKSDAEIVADVAKGEYDVENKWYRGLSNDAKGFLAKLLDPDPSQRLTAQKALEHSWLKGLKASTEPLDSGHAERLLSYQRLQQLRANILAVIMGTQHGKLGGNPADRSDDKNDKRLVPHHTSTVNMDMFKEAFALFDKDESGGIDSDELRGMMVALGQRLSRSEVDDIMRQADTDGDGKISFMEFVSMMNQRLFRRGELTRGDLKAAFDIFDENHDGFICSEELEHMLHLLSNRAIHADEIKKIIQAADKNDDGKIDYDEFCALMQHNLGSGGDHHSKSGDK